MNNQTKQIINSANNDSIEDMIDSILGDGLYISERLLKDDENSKQQTANN